MLVRFVTVPLTSVRVVLSTKTDRKSVRKLAALPGHPSKIMAVLGRWLSRKCVRTTKQFPFNTCMCQTERTQVQHLHTHNTAYNSFLLDITRVDLSSLVPCPSPQLSSLAVRITRRRPGKIYHVMYATVYVTQANCSIF